MSTRILLATFGSFGDIHPIMAVALELKSRGHQPVVATSELYRAKIEAAEIGFHAVRPNVPPPSESRELIAKAMDARRGSEYLFREMLMPSLRDSYEDLHAAARNSDLLISHPATPAAPLVAQALEMKWMSVALSPVSLWSIYDPPVLLPLPIFERWRGGQLSVSVQRAVKRMAERFSLHWIAPMYQLRQELGLSRGAHPIFEGQHSPHGVLALFSRVLAAPQPDWPPNTTVCGYCFYDQRGAMEAMKQEYSEETHPALREFLNCGEPPIVFTLGSAAVFDARDFYEQSTLIARHLKRRALLLIGHQENRPSNLPENDSQIAAFDYAPYSEVFSRAAAIVHQGGAGTTGQVLRSGKPSLVMPYSHDQPDHAARLQRLGVARTLPRRKYEASRVVRELEMLLGDANNRLRAESIARQIEKENGPRVAADAIEKVLRL